jgi:hypothetical protein
VTNILPKMPNDYDQLEPWFAVIRHLNSITVTGSLQFITTTIFIDRERKPILWGGIERHDLYPRSRKVGVLDVE